MHGVATQLQDALQDKEVELNTYKNTVSGELSKKDLEIDKLNKRAEIL
jgi:hypothetical protein